MKAVLILFLSSIYLFGCAQKKRPIKGKNDFQKQINSEFKDATTSPLKDVDRKNFTGLEFFKIDSNYVVTAMLNRTLNSNWFAMQTTTDRVSNERVYGILRFELKGNTYQLNIYQGQELMSTPGYEDHLFLPFLDNTNGVETYSGGRYIDVSIPKGDTLIIDFNKAYNPYCAYNEKYSCPIVPIENYLKTRIEAGVKAFVKG